MTEEFLHHSNVSSITEQQCGHCVPQHVRGNMPLDSCFLPEPCDDVSDPLCRETPASSIEKQCCAVSANSRAGFQMSTLDSHGLLVHAQQAPPEARERVTSEIKLKRLLLRRYPFYLSKLIGLPPLTARLRTHARVDLEAVSASFAQERSWFNLQHCEMLAAKFGIPFAEVYAGPMRPLPARQGYKQLGYVLAEMMAYRATLADPTVSDPPFEIAYFHIARQLGINPEVWKLARAFGKRFSRVTLPSGLVVGLAMPLDIRRDADAAWRACEYTLPMRLLLHLRGEEA
jgi:hypothetical protein